MSKSNPCFSLDTQEIEYSTDLSDHSSTESHLDSLDIENLKPYDFEPTQKLSTSSCESLPDTSRYSNEEVSDDTSCIGNTNWCKCGKCREMQTKLESLCCLDTNEIPENYFKGCKCISDSEDFKSLCHQEVVLKNVLFTLNDLRGDPLGNIENNMLRFAAYKQYVWWVHNYLGKGNRRVIPSCTIWSIQDKFPLNTNAYIPFMESKYEEHL